MGALSVLGLVMTVAGSAGPAAAASAAYGSCAAVQVIEVRGTGEAQPAGGVLPPLASQITSQSRASVLTYGLPYPASSDWGKSVSAGVSLLTDRVSVSAAYCPGQRFVLIGYSQGAWVIGDALANAGAAGAGGLGAKVAAVILYGDPRFRAGEPYTIGNFRSGVNGVLPRPAGALSPYANRIRSYCYGDDDICQNGATGSGHSRYTQITQDAANFAVNKIGS